MSTAGKPAACVASLRRCIFVSQDRHLRRGHPLYIRLWTRWCRVLLPLLMTVHPRCVVGKANQITVCGLARACAGEDLG